MATPKTLSQVEIIRSLGEALAWFQKELTWGVPPPELRHLTGRIGELYAAMITRGQMAPAINQRGYDVVSGDNNERISVKTITSSTHVDFRESTLGQVDRVTVLRIDVDGDEVSIKGLLDGTPAELVPLCQNNNGSYSYPVNSIQRPRRPIADLLVEDQAEFRGYSIKRYENGTIIVENNGVPEASAMPILKKIATEIGVSLLNSNDNPRNTRQLGAEVIEALKQRARPT